MPDFRIEKEYQGVVAGIDEVGRGPWAGPVIAAAVILPRNICRELMDGLDDSKKLSRAQREALHTMVSRRAFANLPCLGRAVIEGDSLSLSIAAASIVAKVTRDRIMASLALRYPAFGWERNSGYRKRAPKWSLFSRGNTPSPANLSPIAKILGLHRK